MLTYIPATERRHASPAPWLNSYFLFSFADYYDPKNMHFGPLRVFNDDAVAANSGFPQHPHSEMEIVTLVLDGEIAHEDTMGNKTTIKAGEVQRMTAGTGLAHSEYNKTDKPLQLYQLWFLPNQRGLSPSYEQKDLDFLDSTNELVPLVSGQKVLEDVVYINSNSTIYWSNLRAGKEVQFKTFPIRLTFIYVREGTIFVNGTELGAGDQARLTDEHVVDIRADKDAQFILIDLPAAEANY
ncbi:pirin family protein [Hymenobacter busanensis]|uniref:Pirin family protein n=1 Tax=Hymenobacter busanensis TaxID=2607656 RepID=A0A7L4ZVB9_9BACT|nr:pirin-like bicupin family protein [Hymenobacter busanensis]KAA9327510.1 pirin family protein [Hymenobacter busanensis]QHJ06152.1 cupin domain-containing protein [Hymenobacter busanensis]